MRRIAVVMGAVIAAITISSPAYAFAHDRVANPLLHTVLDVLTLAIVSSPLWTAYFWGRAPKARLVALIAVVQVPVAVFAFVPINDPVLHVVALTLGLTITGTSLWYARRAAKPAEATDPAQVSAP